MEGTDVSTELWRHPKKFDCYSSVKESITLGKAGVKSYKSCTI